MLTLYTGIVMNDWSKVKISQIKKSDETFNFKIEVDGITLHEVVNTQPKVMSNKRVWAIPNNAMNPPAPAKLRKIKLLTHNCDYGKTWTGTGCTAGELLSSNLFHHPRIRDTRHFISV